MFPALLCVWGRASGLLVLLALTFLVAQLRSQRVGGGRSVLVHVQREQRGRRAFAGVGLLGPSVSTGAAMLMFQAGARPPALTLEPFCLKERMLNMQVDSFCNKSNMFSFIKDVSHRKPQMLSERRR